MNNIDLQEKLAVHLLKQIPNHKDFISEDLVGEYDLNGGIAQFLKDAVKYLMKIKGLKPNDEIVIDTVDPVGFMTVYNNEGEYELSISLYGQKTKYFKSKNAGQIIGKTISIFKDQLLRGRKEFKDKYGK